MSTRRLASPRPAAAVPSSFTPLCHHLLQRKCVCGTSGPTGECGECAKKRQRRTQGSGFESRDDSSVPPIVHEVLRSPGRPLDAPTRAFIEPRFGHDFSRVRAHTDTRAAESAAAVNALAYTVGRHVVFATGQYAPETRSGRALLGHELAHVVQQSAASDTASNVLVVGKTGAAAELEAEKSGQAVVSASADPSSTRLSSAIDVHVQRAAGVPDLPPVQGQLNLSIDDSGRVSVTIAGPENTPVVKQPTIGIRRDPNGKYHILVGGKDKLVAVEEIPALLRSAVNEAAKPGAKPAAPSLQVPRCDQLKKLDGSGFKTFDEHRVDLILNPNWFCLTPALYDALIESCQASEPGTTRPEPREAVPPAVPEGMAVA